MKNKLYYIYLVILTALVAGCQDEAMFTAEDDGLVTVSYRVKVGDNLQSRAIGDGEQVNELIVGVFQDGEQIKQYTCEVEERTAEINIPLLKTETYDLVFWAQKEDNGIYNTNDLSNITIDYSQYDGISLVDTEAFEAFSTVRRVENLTDTVGTDITLTRPFAQINVAAREEELVADGNSVDFIISKVYTKYNLLTGEVIEEADNQNFSFAFSEDDITRKQQISISGTNYYYLASAYLFAPAKVALTGGIYKGRDLEKELNFPELPLAANTRTNIYGDMIQQEELPAWDGIFPPEESTLTIEENKYIIDDASDLAWLSKYSATLAANSTFLQTVDINMGSKTIESIQLPEGSIYDGGDKKIINYANSLFGDATKVSVKNLTVENAVVPTNGVTHVGVLMNTLSGSATFDNVIVTNSTATTTNGAAGGLVGYIKNNDTEPLVVNFTKCTATNNTVSGSLTTGVYVGRFRGYDNTETLTFSADCGDSSATIDSNAKASYYITDNAACWFTSAQTTFGKYSGWLGCEEYYRGTINYGAVRYIPKWDGTTKIAPLTEGNTKLIYSAFDLANCAGTNPGTIKFMENVDLGAKVFNPLTNLSKLIGEDKTIYNMKVETTFNTNSWDGGGFVRRCSAAIIENITFQDADVKVTHASGSDGDAYASIVCGTAEGNNTMTNVKVIGGKLYGCNKMGGIAGYITGTFTATNCTVDGLSIENYDSGGKDKLGFKANGEVGGAFGFIAANSTISGCYVKNTTLNCIGVNNGRALFLFKYAGRHVNEFIGDIRTTSGQEIVITLDEKEFTGNTYKSRKDQYSECKYIGHCYYTDVNAVVAKIQDTKGTVSVNDKSITVAKNY